MDTPTSGINASPHRPRRYARTAPQGVQEPALAGDGAESDNSITDASDSGSAGVPAPSGESVPEPTVEAPVETMEDTTPKEPPGREVAATSTAKKATTRKRAARKRTTSKTT